MLITLNQVTKSYPKIETSADRVRVLWQALTNTPYQQTHDIIKPLDLSIMRGESLGIIGENGAGKSTLLKLISGVLHPSSGQIAVHCKIAALLELGAGFHPDYSGIDNIRMNATLSGLSPQQLHKKMQAIIDFADIGDYIYEPIKHYSSGMVVRLGFAMITALNPDLLITDEVLAVGDESFQKKCIHWLEQYLEQGGTLLLCSHSMYHIQKLCRHALWLESGQVREYGESLLVTQHYLNYHAEKNRIEQQAAVIYPEDYQVIELKIENKEREVVEYTTLGEDFIVTGRVYSPDGRVPHVAISVNTLDGFSIHGTGSSLQNFALTQLDAQHFVFALCFKNPMLLPGKYLIKAHAMDPEALRLFNTMDTTLTIGGQSFELGHVYLNHQWLKQ